MFWAILPLSVNSSPIFYISEFIKLSTKTKKNDWSNDSKNSNSNSSNSNSSSSSSKTTPYNILRKSVTKLTLNYMKYMQKRERDTQTRTDRQIETVCLDVKLHEIKAKARKSHTDTDRQTERDCVCVWV